MQFSLRRLLIGDPLRTEQASHQKLSNVIALPVFASDALSSVAFATEEIMAALLVAGAIPFFGFTPWLSLGIVVLLAIVTISYQQTIAAYPGGGGAYTVAGANLGSLAGRGAGAALLIDYVLNAAVCASAGAAAVTSLALNYGHDLSRFTVPIAISFIVFIALINLRGVRESGAIFAVPVYGFVAVMFALIGVGLWKYFGGTLIPAHSVAELQAARIAGEHGGMPNLAPFGLFLLLHAFSSGCTALTGVEAISNGVSAFKDPAPENARITMVWMALLLGSIFLGLSYLASKAGALPPNAAGYDETVLSQVARVVFGTGPFYLVVQLATCAILILSANTSFADFPRLSSLMARDGLLPRQLKNIGDKLVFDRGIVVLAFGSIFLVILFKGSVHALIPLFAIGVFLSFTLSQAGMVRRWTRTRTAGWKVKAFTNGLGALVTGIVTVVFGVVKFASGAWVVVLLIPLLILLLSAIRRHYVSAEKQLHLSGETACAPVHHHVLILVSDLHKGILPALQYARAISGNVEALHIGIDPRRVAFLREHWDHYANGVPLVVLDSPYRELVDPVLDYIDALQRNAENGLVTVVIPEALTGNWLSDLLHGQAGIRLLWPLRSKAGVVAVHVPYHIKPFVKLDFGTENAGAPAEKSAGVSP